MQDDQRIPRSIRSLSKKAEGGNLKALYQMTRFRSEGRYVEKNEEKVRDYIGKISKKLESSKFIINKLKVVDFRGLNEVDVTFHPELTILIGNNGAGKSAILDALSMSLSWFGANVRKEDTTASSIKEDDISTNNSAHYAAIVSEIELNKESHFSMMLSKVKDGHRERRDSELVEIKSLSGMYRFSNDFSKNFNLPIIAHYTVFRSVGVSKAELINSQKKLKEKKWSKLLAYEHALKENHDFSGFLAWLIRFDAVEKQMNRGETGSEISELSEEIGSLKSFISQFDENNSNPEASLNSIRELISSKIIRLEQLEKDQKRSELIGRLGSLDLVFEAINIFMPGLDGMHLDYTGDYIDLKMYKDKSPISVLHLSQGEKSLMALVGDVARRLIMLNPGRDNALEGQGVVMVDEIDLHLHPEWQQKVVGRLRKTFPNIQFILTTHSPQVLSTVKNENIRVVDRNNNLVFTPYAKSYGEESQNVMQAIMGVDPQPPVPEREELKNLTELVDSGRYESAYAQKLLNELTNSLSDNHPQLLRIKRSIRRQKALKS